MKKVFLAGSTGSIGINSLNVIRELKGEFNVAALSINSNTALLQQQVIEFEPETVIINDYQAYQEFKSLGLNCKVLFGEQEMCNAAAAMEYDIFLGAIVGFAGLPAVIEAVKRGKRIALANKETLVAAGEFVKNLCRKNNAEILPVDSEHSAIFQCLVGENKESIEKIILTASGGPFREYSKSMLQSVSVEQALAHPNWKMGSKVTIDSATLMNKGLEVIEAYWLFDVEIKDIDVVIHPQSIIHSMVQYRDGSIKAQLGLPDMKLPIQYALTYPERRQNTFARANFPLIGSLSFFEPDFDKFECLKLAFDALNAGGMSTCILNAANEVAVNKFLTGDIKFVEIPNLIKNALSKIQNGICEDLESIIECDKITRRYVSEMN
ncbi:MAG: 1-deoxy-D-xylulose-5-phosphate reductoisomerase [Bacteroidota bacterium]|nr:1-deoxy-D-xylulose-5-phosphate reductoisomerase [Bacteroidota bacterium]